MTKIIPPDLTATNFRYSVVHNFLNDNKHISFYEDSKVNKDILKGIREIYTAAGEGPPPTILGGESSFKVFQNIAQHLVNKKNLNINVFEKTHVDSYNERANNKLLSVENYFRKTCGGVEIFSSTQLLSFLFVRDFRRMLYSGSLFFINKEFILFSNNVTFSIKRDDQSNFHNETGPTHEWSDGFKLYHWHGTQVPQSWIMDRAKLDPTDILNVEDVGLRAIGCEIVGWDKMASQLDRKIIDGIPYSDVGALVELTLPDLPRAGRFLMAMCPRNGQIVEGVPYESDIDGSPINTALEAQAWRDGLTSQNYVHPTKRT